MQLKQQLLKLFSDAETPQEKSGQNKDKVAEHAGLVEGPRVQVHSSTEILLKREGLRIFWISSAAVCCSSGKWHHCTTTNTGSVRVSSPLHILPSESYARTWVIPPGSMALVLMANSSFRSKPRQTLAQFLLRQDTIRAMELHRNYPNYKWKWAAELGPECSLPRPKDSSLRLAMK